MSQSFVNASVLSDTIDEDIDKKEFMAKHGANLLSELNFQDKDTKLNFNGLDLIPEDAKNFATIGILLILLYMIGLTNELKLSVSNQSSICRGFIAFQRSKLSILLLACWLLAPPLIAIFNLLLIAKESNKELVITATGIMLFSTLVVLYHFIAARKKVFQPVIEVTEESLSGIAEQDN